MLNVPAFKYPIVEKLYQIDFFIENEVLEEILALGQEVVPDLEKILNDAADNFDQYKEEEWPQFFHLNHALYLLCELNAQTSFPHVLGLLDKSEDFMEWWFNIELYDEFPPLLYKLGITHLDLLFSYARDENKPLNYRAIVHGVITKLALGFPEKREEILRYYEIHLNELLAGADELDEKYPEDDQRFGLSNGANIYEYITYLIDYLQEMGASELDQLIQQFYEADLIIKIILGTADNIRYNLVPMGVVDNIFDRYEMLRDSWLGNNHPITPMPTTTTKVMTTGLLRKTPTAMKTRMMTQVGIITNCRTMKNHIR
ncbi:MAG: DUF1186 domain-containing protein [Bacteroidia bacterium]|nr:DUF1186 domain-containing protein [Bacteroidia bacterium]